MKQANIKINYKIDNGKLWYLQVDIASNGAETLEKISEKYDIVLMDIGLPDKDGYALTKEIRAKGFKMPIIALTAHVLQTDHAKCLAVGMNDVIKKPIDIDKVKKALIHFISDKP